jgi:aspartyl-tRNA(Asn)/glutamyl-tRNA(Gln) amidotransferase subunit A
VVAGLAAGSGAAVLGAWGCTTRPSAGPGSTRDLELMDLRTAADAVRSRGVSPVELTQACLDRIARLDPRIDAFITVTAESALADARRAEDEVVRGRWRGPLHGIPIAVKDNIDTAGVRTTAASALFEDRVPEDDAEVVRQLKAAGAVFLGKLNLHEFALGTTSAISHYGPVHNPWDLERVAGGSSGGCGAAVAASMCFGAVGTDTGGSIRVPAACCGIVGFKPTFDVVSTRGLVPVSTSFDHAGPLCRTVADSALLFGAMTDHRIAAQYDAGEPPRVDHLRIGVLRPGGGVCDTDVVPEVAAAVEAAIEVIRTLVSEVREAELPMPDLGSLIDAEAYAYHARYLAIHADRYDSRTRAMILPGQAVSPVEVARLKQALAEHRASVGRAFSSVDLMVVATLPVLPPTIAECTDPSALGACTFGFSLGGLPCISVPCGFSSSGLPIGLLIGGPPLADARVLALAQAFESATAWHRRRPAG